jgi:hypothetical protein
MYIEGIYRIENEYGVTCTFRGPRRLSPGEVARYLFPAGGCRGFSSNVFLRNMARLYLDMSSQSGNFVVSQVII